MGIAEQRVVIPYIPRDQFLPFHFRTERWGCIVAHRRAGKTVACVNDLIKAALESKKPEPRFAYVAPTYAQAKDVAWEYLKRFASPIPGVTWHETELRVDFPNGARVRLYGAENYERLRGLYLDGVVLDEFGDIDPRAWREVIRPALSDREGWAVFIGTPKGQNDFYEISEKSKSDPTWFHLTLRASETGIVNQGELDDARRQMTLDQYEREYECSFAAAIEGAYYAREIEQAEKERRIGKVPYDPGLFVWTAWDLGIGDSTSIWFFQLNGTAIQVIDHYEAAGVGLDHYVKIIRERNYMYAEHILPHDGNNRDWATGKTRIEILQQLGLKTTLLTRDSVDDGIQLVRLTFPRIWIDAEKCADGLKALKHYRREWSEKRKAFNPTPYKEWCTHAADAFRYLVIGANNIRRPINKSPPVSYGGSSGWMAG
jgi:hypothetical protein